MSKVESKPAILTRGRARAEFVARVARLKGVECGHCCWCCLLGTWKVKVQLAEFACDRQSVECSQGASIASQSCLKVYCHCDESRTDVRKPEHDASTPAAQDCSN